MSVCRCTYTCKKEEENGTLCRSQFSNQIRREKPNNHVYDFPTATAIRPTGFQRKKEGERNKENKLVRAELFFPYTWFILFAAVFHFNHHSFSTLQAFVIASIYLLHLSRIVSIRLKKCAASAAGAAIFRFFVFVLVFFFFHCLGFLSWKKFL